MAVATRKNALTRIHGLSRANESLPTMETSHYRYSPDMRRSSVLNKREGNKCIAFKTLLRLEARRFGNLSYERVGFRPHRICKSEKIVTVSTI